MHSNTTKHIKSNGSCLYLVYFANESNISLSDLRATKFVMNAVVKCSPYINSRTGPTQCGRCQLYGHGNKNCNLPSRCLHCSGKHDSKQCPNQASISTTPFTPKCCLCSGAHTSNDRGCPKRIEFMMMRIKTSEHQAHAHHNKSTNATKPHRALDNTKDFPALPQKRPHQIQNHWFTNISQNNHSTTEYASPKINTQANTNQQNRTHHPPNGADLFSIDELLQLSNDLMSALSKCTSKHEQFQVLTELSIKYLYSNVK